jgi:cathepsin L
MRVVAILAILAIAALVVVEARAHTNQDDQKAFSAFVKKYGKTYAHDEFFARFTIFKQNTQIIAEHNASNSTYTMSMNEFGDLTFAEFHARYTGYNHREMTHLRAKNGPKHVLGGEPTPASVDWRTKGAVTPIKNQAQCGSCWAFSTTGSVEGGDFLNTGVLNSLSEQQLVDCSSSTGDQGCNGGLMDDAFQWIINNKGLCSEASYPYTAATGTCQTTCTVIGGQGITGFTDVTAGSEDALLAAIVLNPVSVAIEADQQGFQFYSGGVFAGACGTALDHGVLAVGYGTDSTQPAGSQDYYIVKNSWGNTWGEAGYIRLVRGINQCGISNAASYPTYKAKATHRTHRK